MGASHSKLPEPVVGEKLVERLHTLEVKDIRSEAEKEYVHVGDEKVPQSKYSPTVSISAAEQWG